MSSSFSSCFGLGNGKSIWSSCLDLQHVKSGRFFSVDSRNDLFFNKVLSLCVEESSESLGLKSTDGCNFFCVFEVLVMEVFLVLYCWVVEGRGSLWFA